jgi:hypothetical protein
MKDGYDIDILGLKINLPSTLHGTISFSLLVLSIAGVVFFLVHNNYGFRSKGRGGESTELYCVNLDPNSDADKRVAAKLVTVQFWTPSEKTWDNLDPQFRTAANGWQRVDKGKVDSFMVEMRERFSTEIRASESIDFGKNCMKTGYWWSMTVNDDFDLNDNDFKVFYFGFWQSRTKLYVEAYANSGQYLSQERKPQPSDDR